MIVGGGPVGIELAAEIATKYPDKNLILLHSKSLFLKRLNSKCHEYSYRFLSKRNASFILNERLVKYNKVFVTDKNRKIRADIAFLCTGITPNSEFLKRGDIKLDKKNYVIVNNFLQAKGHSNIFAAGDIASIQEEKTAQNSAKQARIVVKNIMHIEKNEQLEQYDSSQRIMVISLGKYDGIMTYKNHAVKGIIPGILKSIIELKTMLRYK